jgi:hypothetical protein
MSNSITSSMGDTTLVFNPDMLLAFFRIAKAVTEPPPKNIDFKKRVLRYAGSQHVPPFASIPYSGHFRTVLSFGPVTRTIFGSPLYDYYGFICRPPIRDNAQNRY